MSEAAYYLRRNVVLEPLFNQWYAWWYLIPPSTAPLYLAHQHMKIMRSFVAQPAVHVAAMKNPDLVGGPYVDLPASRVDEVERLIDETERRHARLLELADAIKALDGVLADQPAGFSLEDAYRRVPAPLKGLVELTYDLKNNPTFRFVEGLLYRSPLYAESAQSLALFRIDGDARPFVFSTPRLPGPDRLHLAVPLRDPIIDALIAHRAAPAPLARFQELCGAREDQSEVLRSLLTLDPPPPGPERPRGDGVRVRYFGHACVLVESRDVAVLVDPAVSYPYPTDLPRYTYDDLPEKIDYVLITHGHADHLMFETLLQIRRRVGTVVVPRSSGALEDPSMRLGLQATGFRDVVEIDDMEEIAVPGGSITGVPFFGEHGDLGVRSKTAYLVRLHGRAVVVAADSNALEPALYDRVREAVGPVDALFLGMECAGAPMSWSYGPLMLAQLSRKMDQTRRLNGCDFGRARAIVERLGARRVYVYAMGQEPWLNHVMAIHYEDSSPQMVESRRLVEHCRAAGLVAERLYCQREIELD